MVENATITCLFVKENIVENKFEFCIRRRYHMPKNNKKTKSKLREIINQKTAGPWKRDYFTTKYRIKQMKHLFDFG